MTVFINDFSTQSNTSSHLECIREALVRCKKMRLALNPNEIILGVHKGILLGYVISKKGREPNPKNISVIDELPTPINVNEIVKLLGHMGWYKELIPNFSKIAVSITLLFKNDCKFK